MVSFWRVCVHNTGSSPPPPALSPTMNRRPLFTNDLSDLLATNNNNFDSVVKKRVNFEHGTKNHRVVVAGDDHEDANLLNEYNTNNNGDDDDDELLLENKQSELKRRCIDYHTPSVLDVSSRLYRKTNRRSHALPGGSGLAGYPHLQCHTNYLKWMGMPSGDGANGGNVVASVGYLTYCAHVTRAKNSQPVL